MSRCFVKWAKRWRPWGFCIKGGQRWSIKCCDMWCSCDAITEAVYTRNVIQPLPGQLHGHNSMNLKVWSGAIGVSTCNQRLESEGWTRYLGGCSTNEDEASQFSVQVCSTIFLHFFEHLWAIFSGDKRTAIWAVYVQLPVMMEVSRGPGGVDLELING